MQHFVSFQPTQFSTEANFIRLSDKNINAARGLSVKNLNNQSNPNSFTQLSGLKQSEYTPTRHDAIQHTPITKQHYKTLVGKDPNQYFPEGSLSKTGGMTSTPMPLAQNVPEKVNTATELMTNVIGAPRGRDRANVRYTDSVPDNVTPDVIHSYIKKKNTEPERLAAMLPLGYEIENVSNQQFKDDYIKRMKESKDRLLPEKPKLPDNPSLYDKYQARNSFTDNYPRYGNVEYDEWKARKVTGGLQTGLTPVPPKTQNKLNQISNRKYEEQRKAK